MALIVDIARCKVVHPDGEITRGRFVYNAHRAAVWVEDKPSRSAERVLYASGVEYLRPSTAREPHVVLFSDGSIWQITQIGGGGCGCGSPLKGKSYEDLLAEELVSA